MLVEQWIQDRLLADASIVALVEDRIYQTNIPTDAAQEDETIPIPFIVHTVTSEELEQVLAGQIFSRFEINVDLWEHNASDMLALHSLVKARLNDARDMDNLVRLCQYKGRSAIPNEEGAFAIQHTYSIVMAE